MMSSYTRWARNSRGMYTRIKSHDLAETRLNAAQLIPDNEIFRTVVCLPLFLKKFLDFSWKTTFGLLLPCIRQQTQLKRMISRSQNILIWEGSPNPAPERMAHLGIAVSSTMLCPAELQSGSLSSLPWRLTFPCFLALKCWSQPLEKH